MNRSLAILALTALPVTSLYAVNQTESLEQLTVIATRVDNDVEDLPYNVSVITAADIRKSAVRTLPELLSLSAGVQVRNSFGNNAARSTLDIRGFGSTGTQNSLILLDGKRLNDIDQSAINYAAIPLDNILRVEVIRGAGGVIYGDGAVGGVINIITRAAAPDEKRIKLRQTIASYDTYESSVNAVYGTETTSFNLYANYIDSDGYRDNNELDQKNLLGDLRYQLNNIELFSKFGLSAQKLGLPGNRTVNPATGLNELADDRRGTNEPNNYANEDLTFFTSGINGQTGKGLQYIIDFGWRGKEQESFFENQSRYIETELNTLFVTPRLIWKFGNDAVNHRIDTGVDVYHYSYDSVIANNKTNRNRPIRNLDATQTSYAVYLNDLVKLNQATSVQLGSRIQHVRLSAKDDFNSTAPGASAFDAEAADFDNSDTEYLFNLGAKHRYSNAFFVFTNVGQSVRFANIDDRNQLSFAPPLFTPSREFTDLKPQQSRHLDLGIGYNKDRLDMTLTAYYMRLEDEIYFNPSSFLNENLDKTERYGFESSVAIKWSENTSTIANYSYTRSRFRDGAFEGNNVPLVPRNSFSFIGQYSPVKNLDFNAQWNYVGSRYFANDLSNSFFKRIDGYSTVDAKLLYRYKDVDIEVAANNLMDERFFDFGVNSTTSNTFNALPLPERNFFVTIGYNFSR